MKSLHFFGLILVAFLSWEISASVDRRPNIVIFLADDLGIGDIGCYGNKTLVTENIDRLCKEGVKLEHHVAASPMCTPSRAALLTGRYAWKTGLDNPGSPRVFVHAFTHHGLRANETTWVDSLKGEGYKTALIGKWHLGWDKETLGDHVHGPLNHGFQYFFGIPWTLFPAFDDSRVDSLWQFEENHSPLFAQISAVLLALYVFKPGKWKSALILTLTAVSGFSIWFFTEHFNLLHPRIS